MIFNLCWLPSWGTTKPRGSRYLMIKESGFKDQMHYGFLGPNALMIRYLDPQGNVQFLQDFQGQPRFDPHVLEISVTV